MKRNQRIPCQQWYVITSLISNLLYVLLIFETAQTSTTNELGELDDKEFDDYVSRFLKDLEGANLSPLHQNVGELHRLRQENNKLIKRDNPPHPKDSPDVGGAQPLPKRPHPKDSPDVGAAQPLPKQARQPSPPKGFS